MDERGPTTNVIQFPAHRRGTLEDTLSGFPERSGEGWFGTRAEREVTALHAEIRGWRTITDRVGPAQAEETLGRVVSRILETLSSMDAGSVTVGGEPLQPVIACTFEGDGHAYRALYAAVAIRGAAGKTQFPALPGHQYQVCMGVNSGAVVDARLATDGEGTIEFQSVGTVEMFAARLQEFAGPGQVFLSADTAELAGELAATRSIGDVRVNAAGERREAFILTGIAAADALPAHTPPAVAEPES